MKRGIMHEITMGLALGLGLLSAAILVTGTAQAQTTAPALLPAPVLAATVPAENAVVSAPVTELRFEYATEVHLMDVQLVKIFEERRESSHPFQADGAYIRGKAFVFPLQQPITRPGTYRVQVMAQPLDNGNSASTTYEFTVPDPAAPPPEPTPES